LFAPKEGQLYDWQIAKELSKRFSKLANYSVPFLFRQFNPRQLLNFALLSGPYGKWSSPARFFKGLNLQKLIDSKHGINFGPLQPRIPEVLNTQDGKIQIAADVFLEGLKEVKEKLNNYSTTRQPNEFKLIGRRHLRSNNSWMHNVEGLMKGKNRCTAMIHTADAAVLDLENGEIINLMDLVIIKKELDYP